MFAATEIPDRRAARMGGASCATMRYCGGAGDSRMPARMKLDYQLGSAPARAARRVDAETPMRILVIGDLSGRGERSVEDFAKRRPLPVDIDTFDAVLRRISPRATLSGVAADPIEIVFDDLDAFHPDSLYTRIPVLARLRELRERMRNPATFASAAEAFRALEGQAPAAASSPQPQASGKSEDDADTLSRLLGRGAAAPPQSAAPAKAGIDAFIRTVIAEHIQPD